MASPSNSPAGSAVALCRNRLCNCLPLRRGVAMVGVATMVGHTYGAIRARAAHVNLRAAAYRAFCNDRQASIFTSLARGRDTMWGALGSPHAPTAKQSFDASFARVKDARAVGGRGARAPPPAETELHGLLSHGSC